MTYYTKVWHNSLMHHVCHWFHKMKDLCALLQLWNNLTGHSYRAL